MTQYVLIPEKTREACYKLLSVCYQLPSSEWQQIELIDGLVQTFEVLNSEALSDGKDMKCIIDETDDFTPLQVDFAKLFIGPSRLLAAPYASVYLGRERQIKTESTNEVLEFYYKVGLDIENNMEIPDHIRVELEVMYYLALKERLAKKEGNMEEEKLYAGYQKEFLLKHLGTWVDAFTDDVAKEAANDFYKHLAKVTAIFIKEEIRKLPR
jgi:TorA maturation chaperone TorD